MIFRLGGRSCSHITLHAFFLDPGATPQNEQHLPTTIVALLLRLFHSCRGVYEHEAGT